MLTALLGGLIKICFTNSGILGPDMLSLLTYGNSCTTEVSNLKLELEREYKQFSLEGPWTLGAASDASSHSW